MANEFLIVNAGLSECGKSSLFDSILDRDVFTEFSSKHEKKVAQWLDDVNLIDTAGCSIADRYDFEMLKNIYQNASLIVFVHNMKLKTFTKTELDGINTLKNLFDNPNL